MRIEAQLSVRGFASDAVQADIPSLLEEFRLRDVFLETAARWNAEDRTIELRVVAEGTSPDAAREMIYDEVFDAVIASVRALGSIELTIDSCGAAGPAGQAGRQR